MLRLLPLLFLAASAPPEPAAPILSPERIKADVATLAADDLRGRGPTQQGEPLTTDFLAKRFAALGLKPLGADGSYLQPVPLLRWTRGATTITATVRGKAVPLRPGIEIAASSRIAGTTTLTDVPVVFVGYGVVEPRLGYDPYAGLDVRGKVVLALAGDPDVEAGRDLGFGGRAAVPASRTKISEAQKRGAAAFLTIHEEFAASYPWSQIANGDAMPGYALDEGAEPTPYGLRGNVRGDIGRLMLKASGLNYAAMKRAAQAASFRGVMLKGVTLSATVETALDRVVSHNVVGLLPGSDPKAGTILYGAHWDANGENASDPPADQIRNGAIDNATGTATLLEIARAFTSGPRPRRGVVFGLWTAEEKGLLGASWYAGHPALPLETTAAQFNLDPHVVLGRTRNLELIGVGRTPLEADLHRVALAQGLRVVPEENSEAGWYYRSDHYAFAQKGVPGVYFRAGRDLVAGGMAAGEAKRAAYNSRCYHQPCDEFDPAWDMTGAAQEGSVAFALGREIAEGDKWPAWSAGQPFAADRARSDAARR
ncbi:M28 family peptidase [Sphingomonas jatrophae]|uniref:Zn-dependent amino-or carboxypeptidase, M28 family n=1 Tax=Sphingomonas jatrophae TaxID=1166337 RepID=A0A1I6LL77_9SPHN|nr:M28 family peptidase [Sphingomonas jatrophae]SFS04317.1 Zn-dependent amino-or carboxypeptidase, M28 family [Sphingomonas jatrophae]